MNLSKLPAQKDPARDFITLGADALSLTSFSRSLLIHRHQRKSVLELAHEMVIRFGIPKTF